MMLSENIQKLRAEKNMSQLDLADALEVSRQSVSKWETGAAVPELDKLIKLSELFGITLDQLVGRESPPPPEPVPAEAPTAPEPPTVVYIEKPVFPAFSRQQIIGSVILFCALIYGLILYRGLSMAETISMVIPVIACGAVFLLTAHPLFWCGWIWFLGFWDHFFILFPRWERHIFMILVGIAIPAAMSLWTIHMVRKRIIKIPVWVLCLGAVILLLLLYLLALNTVSFY